MVLVYLRVLQTVSRVSAIVFCLSHNEKITSLKKRNDFPYHFYSVKMWVLDTWISDIHISMALHLGYTCQGKTTLEVFILCILILIVIFTFPDSHHLDLQV